MHLKNRILHLSLLSLLPAMLFLGFFFPNTRIYPLRGIMLFYRWVILFLIVIIAIFYRPFKGNGNYAKQAAPVSPILYLFFLSFIWTGLSIFGSADPRISLLKWVAFLSFLVFCGIYTSLMSSREQIIAALMPIMYIFILIIWATPLATRYYPQAGPSVGSLNGFFVYPNQLGHFLATFGIPSALYLLSKSQERWEGVFLTATLGLSLYFTIASKSRAATAITLVVLAVALYRWDNQKIRNLRLFLAGLLALALLMHLGLVARVHSYIYKYETPYHRSDLLASRRSFWEATMEAYEKRSTFGYGFGVQEGLEQDSMEFRTVAGREQGSTICGLLEEVGLAGSMPIFLILLWMGYSSGLSVCRSSDSLDLFLSRVFLTGLSLALVENYLLYLGNANSILVFFAFFMRERLLRLSYMKGKELRPISDRSMLVQRLQVLK